jgi:hypothetical protein
MIWRNPMTVQSWEKIADAMKEVSDDFEFDNLGRIVVKDPKVIQIVRDRTGKLGTAGRMADTNYICPTNAYCPPKSAITAAQ